MISLSLMEFSIELRRRDSRVARLPGMEPGAIAVQTHLESRAGG